MNTRTERKSDRARRRILEAARRRFASEGYERTTIRAVAADAAIHPSMVMRYYGSKEALFAAAAEFDLRLPALADILESGRGTALVRHFLRRWEDPADQSLVVLLRAAGTNEAAMKRMRDIFAHQLTPALAAVCASQDVSRRAALIATQMLGLAYCRYVLALPPLVEMSPDELCRYLGPAVQRYLSEEL